MDPQQPQQSDQQPFFNQPFRPPVEPIVIAPAGAGAATPTPTPAAGNKTTLIVGIIAGIELLVIGGLLLAVLSKAPAPVAKTDTPTAAQAAVGQPATSTSVQQVNDAISQDISALNDEKDFPSATLNDKSLGL